MKSMMKRLAVLLSVLMLALALTGCTQESKQPEAPVAEVTESEAPAAEAPAGNP